MSAPKTPTALPHRAQPLPLAAVALESTIIAHGFPYPDNATLAHELERVVTSHGAIAKTIAVVEGAPVIGLSATQLDHLAAHGSDYRKVAASDLAVVCARGQSAATTVSATCALAAEAGLRVFATGGIGGVHRAIDGIDSGDVSQDLTALARHDLAVISAGAKSILDLPRTLEMLETLGVLVLGFGCDEFPAFYSRGSGLPLDHRVDEIGELAEICHWRWKRGAGGILIVQPVPSAVEVPREQADLVIGEALVRARTEGVRGKAVTPYVLRYLAAQLGGQFIAANRALALSNAALGAQLAQALPSSA